MKPDFVLLAVQNPAASANFYQVLLGSQALELSPTFAMFKLNDSTMLGLWSEKTMEPRVMGAAGCSELAMTVESRTAVDTLHVDWRAKGVSILQSPVDMDFGYTFTGADPDGHRLRVLSQEAA